MHRSRVATRRLRSTLRTFGEVLEAGSVKDIGHELRWHARRLGEARDTEVLRERLTAALAEVPEPAGDAVIGSVTSALADAHAIAHAGLVESMARQRYEELQLGLEQLLVAPRRDRIAAEPASLVLPPMLGTAVTRVRELASGAEARPDDLARWHEVRKAAKSVRYGAEVLLGVLGGTAEEWRSHWERVTEALGAVQDCVVAAQVLEELASHTMVEGLPREPFDALLAHQEAVRADALRRGRAALAAALVLQPGPESFGA